VGEALGAERNIINEQLLRLSYKDERNIRNFLKNWGGLESLSLKGDTVAMCIIADLKEVTGIYPENFSRQSKEKFNLGYLRGRLSHYQYMSIAYVLVLGYSQEEVAYIMGVERSVVSRNIDSGIRRIKKALKAELEED
jgi:predicted DNA-binding protein (UPF0251 family)